MRSKSCYCLRRCAIYEMAEKKLERGLPLGKRALVKSGENLPGLDIGNEFTE